MLKVKEEIFYIILYFLTVWKKSEYGWIDGKTAEMVKAENFKMKMVKKQIWKAFHSFYFISMCNIDDGRKN